MAQPIQTVGIGSSRVVDGTRAARAAYGPASQAADAEASPPPNRRAGWAGFWGRFLVALLRAFSAPAI